ncbi:CBS domain-containing protein OS=Streptomyces fumanus OX=67302 GN=GCM10018772_11370 PE=4 SV=1 [Streptomyces fumanus]
MTSTPLVRTVQPVQSIRRNEARRGSAAGPRVRDDMTVEVALSLMAGARVDRLVLCDGDDQSVGLITLARLAVLRESPL